MVSDYLHIVCLTAPAPPDYGGAYDLFYKIPALARMGKKVILHYFDYKENRGHHGLESFCVEVHTYRRTSFLKSLLSLKPYIVSSRTSRQLISRLNADNYPVLLEGIHCTGILPYLKDRKVLVRVHNDEAKYYRQLRQNEGNTFKGAYFLYESIVLSRFQKALSRKPQYLFVSEKDKENFRVKYQQENQQFLPCFVPWQHVKAMIGRGEYCLYHGNLTISENKNAALWLAKFVFANINFPLIIAGKNAGALQDKLPPGSKVTLVDNPGDSELYGLIQNAQINVLPSFNSTGVKLKLIHALFEGRFCLSNSAGVNGSGLEKWVSTVESAADWVDAIKGTMQSEFTAAMVQERIKMLAIYDNEVNGYAVTGLL